MHTGMRKHNRFYSDVPVERKSSRSVNHGLEKLQDISVDGLCFRSDAYFNVGREIILEISVFKPALRVRAKVIWCHKNGLQFDTGVQFIDVENGSCIRTVEFLQFLDYYKRALFIAEGKRFTCEEAYSEFINRNAVREMWH